MRLNKRSRNKFLMLLEHYRNYYFKDDQKKKFSLSHMLLEGGAGKHMSHPYEVKELSIGQIKQIIQDTAKGIKVPEKFDGSANLHFSINPTGQPVQLEDIAFIRSDSPEHVGNYQNNLNWLRQQFAGSPGLTTMFMGAKAIVMGCMQLPPALVQEVFGNPLPELQLKMQGKEGEEIPSTFKGTYVNCDILYSDNPIQIDYGVFRIAMHGLKDYYVYDAGKGKLKSDWVDDTEVGNIEGFDTYNDPRFMKFTAALKNAMIKVTNQELIQGLNPEYFKPREFEFSYGGKELLSLNQLTEDEINMLLKDLITVQATYDFKDKDTIGDVLNFFSFKLAPTEVERISKELVDNIPQIFSTKLDAARYLASYIVNQSFKKEDLTSPESLSSSVAAGAAGAKKDLQKAPYGIDKSEIDVLTELGLFTTTSQNKYLRSVIFNLKGEVNETFRIFKDVFYNLGVKLLQGVSSTLMSPEYAAKESQRMTTDLVNALKDYYSLPYFSDVKYQNQYNRESAYSSYEQFMSKNPDSTLTDKDFKRYTNNNAFIDRGREQVRKIELLIKNACDKLGIPVDLNNKQDVIDKAKNLKIDPVEGVVINYMGAKMKLTGAYAPINQLIGFNYAKSMPIQFPRYYAKKFDWEQLPSTNKLCIIPGSFKPPHMGHRKMIEHYISLGCQQILVLVSNPSSDKSVRKIGTDKMISAADAIILWKKLCEDLTTAKIDFIISPHSSPMDCAVSLILQGSKLLPGTTVYFGGSKKPVGVGGEEGDIGAEAATEEVAVDAAAVASAEDQVDAERIIPMYKTPLVKSRINPGLEIADPIDFASPAARLPAKYVQIAQQLGVYDQLPSVMEGRDPGQFHASDLRFYLTEVLNRPELKKVMVYYLKDLPTTNFYINYIWGPEAERQTMGIDNQVTLEERLLRKYIKSMLLK